MFVITVLFDSIVTDLTGAFCEVKMCLILQRDLDYFQSMSPPATDQLSGGSGAGKIQGPPS